MKFDPNINNRHSVRLNGYDYAQAGGYYVTIVTQGRECLFGQIHNAEMILNDTGKMAAKWWNDLPNKFPSVTVDAFVVMPNHFHGILVLADEQRPASGGEGKYGKPVTGSVGVIAGQFKAAVTKRINHVRDTPTAQVWQRNFFERIIRTEDELNLTRHYIEGNPAHWLEDPNYRPDFH